MIVINENRYQYVYFFLSGLFASAMFVLIYITMRVTAVDKLKDDIKVMQQSFAYRLPSSPTWQYNNTWRYIGDPKYGHEIYSAYFDPRIEIIGSYDTSSPRHAQPYGSIRIFAVLPTTFREAISCVLRHDDFTLSEVVAAEAKAINEHHDMPLAAFTIMCPLHVGQEALATNNVRLPQAVAIAYASNRLSHLSPTFVPISYLRHMDEMFGKSRPVLSVCVAPLQFHYSNVLRIVEFVEMYRVLGAEHFYFYHQNTSADVLRLLHYYRDMGVADVLDWQLQGRERTHYGGIVAQFNECPYRAMAVDNYRYAAVVDLDEILVPLKHNSLADYLRQCDEGRTSSFQFRNVFYHILDSNDTFSVPPHTRNRMLYTQLKVRRTVEIMPAHQRSKCIVNTRALVEMGNHQIMRQLPGYSESIVHQAVGLLFHYRNKCINCKAVLMVDYTARRFGSLIWDRVDETCLQLFAENNGLCPLN